MENQPGNGFTSPFGDEHGATLEGPSSGAHDFLVDPKSHAPATGGRDFTKESRPQQMGACEVNPDSVPQGGKLPYPAADPAMGSPNGGTVSEVADKPQHKPFKLGAK